MDAIPLPLTPYSNGLLDAELKRARDFAESPKTNNAGLESYWYPAWTRWLDIVRARLTRKTRHMPSQPIFLSAPQLELYISREASPPDAVFMDVDVQTPRRLGRARTQKPDGNLQMMWYVYFVLHAHPSARLTLNQAFGDGRASIAEYSEC